MLSIYKASAGSGKTHTLTQEYLLMLFREQKKHGDYFKPHSRILAVTFTKKATAEMKERILEALYELSKAPTKSKFYEQLHQTLHINACDIQQQARELLIGILTDYSRFSVSTIDGFFQQVIRTFAMDLGLSTSYELALDGKEVMQQAVDDLFRRIRLAQQHDTDTITWITEFTQHNIDDNRRWNPHETISQFAGELLKEQLIRYMSDVQDFFANKKQLTSYKTMLEQIMKQNEQVVTNIQQQAQSILNNIDGLKKNAVSAFYTPTKDLIEKGLNKTFLGVLEDPNTLYTKSKTTKDQQQLIISLYQQQLQPLYQQLHHAFTQQLTDYHTANAILQNLYTVGLLQEISDQVSETNKKIGRIPISQINTLLHEVIDGQETPFIYERMGQQLNHYMIDEFQDTSALQWENFRPLIEETESKGNDNLIVGDVKQSIYRWRNSDWELLEGVHEHFPNCATPPMKTNWRSAELLIKENEELMLKYSQWVSQTITNNQWQETPLAAAIERIYNPQSIHQEAANELPGVFHLEFYEGTDDEVAQQSLEHTTQLINQLTKEEGFQLSQIALLVRRGRDAELLANHLIAHDIPVQSAEGMRIQSHASVQLLVALLQEQQDPENKVAAAIVQDCYPTLSAEQAQQIQEATHLPLYEQVQQYIQILHLAEQSSALPYLTAFQDCIYQFTQKRVADVGAFLDYWENKKDKATIPSSPVVDAIRILTIHSSKGLEFDVVILPFLNWDLQRFFKNDILWCRPKQAPFNQMPLVAISPTKKILQTHFKNDYIQEALSQYIDNLNLTYVAFTRPKYRLYAYGQMYSKNSKGELKINNIGNLLSYLYHQEGEDNTSSQETQNEEGTFIYHQATTTIAQPKAKKPTINTREATYISSPIGNRLKLRSRAEDDFAEETPLETIDLGILMHEFLAAITTWADADNALQRMLLEGRITAVQQVVLQQQLQELRTLLQKEGKEWWFTQPCKVLNEHDILTTTGNTQRPDRVIIHQGTAIIIDYKFGQEHKKQYQEQLRNYALLLQQMGYTTESYIVYVAQQKIEQVH